ncbi:MAG: transcription antitermination factor NusB [Pirellulales bacterium]|nr:transcription antitermination factor NusB [Pirellulales bacterium]
MATRTEAREVALQVLYQDDLNPRGNPAVGDQMIADRLADEATVEFARELVAGARRHRAEIDQALGQSATNWSLDRMAVTDRAVLRIGAYEILYGGTPVAVAIDEAIELARRFGTAQSAQFVNGVLDALVQGSSDEPRVTNDAKNTET